jgi:hypothetical protein
MLNWKMIVGGLLSVTFLALVQQIEMPGACRVVATASSSDSTDVDVDAVTSTTTPLEGVGALGAGRTIAAAAATILPQATNNPYNDSQRVLSSAPTVKEQQHMPQVYSCMHCMLPLPSHSFPR